MPIEKDPAFLFYPEKFLAGITFLSDAQTGRYIKLLCYQHQFGGFIDEIQFRSVVGDDKLLISKFIETEDGFYNLRLMKEMEKRNRKCNNLSDNAKIRWAKEKEKKCKSNAIASGLHMPSKDTNTNKDKDVVKAKPLKLKYAENVKLTEKEYDQIITKYFNGDKTLMDLAIDKLDSAKLSKGYKYKSDAGAIRSWVAAEINEKSKTKQSNQETITEKNLANAQKVMERMGIE